MAHTINSGRMRVLGNSLRLNAMHACISCVGYSIVAQTMPFSLPKP